MKLRDHPLMSYRGLSNWPPVWTSTTRDSVKTVAGELGLLTYVYSNPHLSGKCFLVIDHAGETYVGTLIFDSHSFCKQVVDLLRGHLKEPIVNLGDLELSDTL